MTKKIEKALFKKILIAMIKSRYEDGAIDGSALSDPKKIREEIVRIRRSFKKGNAKFEIVITHDGSLLRDALKALQEKKYNYASLFFATFFEHILNSVIVRCCKRKKISENETISIIRGVQKMEDKTSWLLKLIDAPRVLENHRKVITAVCDERNAFVHYKFKAIDPDGPTDNDAKIKILENAKKTAAYLKKYQSRVFYRGKKKALENSI